VRRFGLRRSDRSSSAAGSRRREKRVLAQQMSLMPGLVSFGPTCARKIAAAFFIERTGTRSPSAWKT
jgi:hypothetical protein